MLPFPTLETERLILRRMQSGDCDGLFDLYSSDEVTRYIEIPTLAQPDQAESIIAELDSLFQDGLGLRWGVFEREEGLLIGTCGYHSWDRKRFRAEMSYDLGPRHWGQGYMREALLAVLNYGFETMLLHRVEALVDPGDTRSQNLLYGLGFKVEGILREHDYLKGRFLDDMVFALLRQDWARLG